MRECDIPAGMVAGVGSDTALADAPADVAPAGEAVPLPAAPLCIANFFSQIGTLGWRPEPPPPAPFAGWNGRLGKLLFDCEEAGGVWHEEKQAIGPMPALTYGQQHTALAGAVEANVEEAQLHGVKGSAWSSPTSSEGHGCTLVGRHSPETLQ